ncbi:MAG: type VI secretion system-associated protein [Planctomycetes bacterium RBG_16_64_10]|nr:MAG: type VI secretion system-associated protein [Planctomycetes bacterium RBG_16_64_10]
MRSSPVHWSEGMFLRPHQFQAADRYWSELIQTSEQWDHQYNYGLRSIELSEQAIANYKIQVTSCQARLRDGTLIALGIGQDPDRVDLKEALTGLADALVDLRGAFDVEQRVRVYLAVPKLLMGRANVALDGDAGPHRYAAIVQELADENRGGNEQEIGLRSLNVRILLSTQNLAGYELLPIAQIRRASEGEAVPCLDRDYIPPLLAIDAWAPLWRDIVRSIYDILGERIEVLSQQVVSRGINLAAAEPDDLQRILMLMRLNEAYTTLSCMTFATGVHPLVAYTELCRIVGLLSIFRDDRRAPEVPHYDHDDLHGIFQWVKQQIEELIRLVRDPEYEMRYFRGAGRGLEVTLDPKFFTSGWEWFVGVNRGSISQEECRALLQPKQLNWKMGGVGDVDRLVRERATGVGLIPLGQAPRALPPGPNWVYYQVSRDGDAWKDVQLSQTLAVRFTERFIVNLDTLQGQKDLVVSYRGKSIPLQFALFAVRKHQ